MFFTALTGIVTTLVTILLVSALSAEVREWIIRGRAAVKDSIIAIEQRDIAIKTLEETESRNNQLSASNRDLEAKLKALSDKLGASTKSYEEARDLAKAAESRVKGLNTKVGSLNSQVRERTVTLTQVRSKLGEVEKQIKVAADRYNTVKKLRDDSLQRSAELDRELVKAEAELEKTNGDLNLARESVAQVRKDFAETSERLNKALVAAGQELEAAGSKLVEAENMIRIYSEQYRTLFGTSRDASMIFTKGEELARIVVDPTSDRDDAAGDVRRIIATARKVAENKGAERNERGETAGFWPYDSIEAKMQESIRLVLADNQPKLLVATSMFNAFVGEFVPINVLVFPNPIVFKSGEVVADTRIDGNGSEQQVIDQLNEFLKTKVRQKAIDKRMISIGANPSFGQISPNELLPLINTLRNYGRQVRVQAIAKSDTRAAGPLLLEFRLR